jgi:hypothetical protein
MLLVLVAIPLASWTWIVLMARDMYGTMRGASAWMMTSVWDWPHILLLWVMWAVMMTAMTGCRLSIVGRALDSYEAAGNLSLIPRSSPLTRVTHPIGRLTRAAQRQQRMAQIRNVPDARNRTLEATALTGKDSQRPGPVQPDTSCKLLDGCERWLTVVGGVEVDEDYRCERLKVGTSPAGLRALADGSSSARSRKP